MSLDVKRWFILFFQIIISLATGFPYMLSVLAGPLNIEKGWAVGTLMLVFTITMWASSPAMIIFGKLRDKFGNRKLIIIGGICYGISVCVSVLFNNVWGFVIVGGGFSAFCMFGIYVAQIANVGMLFPEMRGLATGIYYAGQSFLFSAAMVPAALLIEKMSVVPAVIIIGIVFSLVTIILGFFAVDPPEGYCPKGKEIPTEVTETLVRGPQYNWIQMIKTPAFYLLLICLIGLMIGGMGFSSNVSLMAQSALNIGVAQGAFYGTIFFIGSGIGGIVSGTLTDRLGGGKAIFMLCLVSLIVVAIYLVCAQGIAVVFGLVVFFVGLGYGGQGTAMAVITMNTFGEKDFGVNLGVVGVSGMIASIIGPLVAGTTNVNTSMIVILVANVVGAIAALLLIKAIKNLYSKWQAENEAGSEA